MKILYHHRVASKDGQYVHIEEIINALTKLGHEVIVVAPGTTEKASFGSDGGWKSKLRALLPKALSELLEFFYSVFDFFKMAMAIIRHRPDVIYERYNLLFPSGIWAKKCFRTKLVLEVNSPLYEERSQYGGIRLNALAKWSEGYAWRNADHVCPVTHVLKRYVLDVGVPDDKITVIPNGIDPQRFNTHSVNPRMAQFENKLVVGFVGFCREWHQLDQLLVLIAKHHNQNLMLLIVGDGPVSESLKQDAILLGMEDRLHITGIVERADMPAWLDQIDIALQPSVTPWSSPLKLIEYLAKGKAIVAPGTENIKELLSDNENALLYSVGSPQSVFDCVEKIAADAALCQRLMRYAAKTIEDKKLTWESNAIRISDIILSINNLQNESVSWQK